MAGMEIRMNSQKIDGIGTLNGGEYDRIEVDGIARLAGDVKAEFLAINGVMNGEGKLACGSMQCDGVCNLKGKLSAGNMKVDGTLNLKNGRLTAGELFCDGCITLNGAKLEGEKIICDGCLNTDSEICADLVKVDGIVKAGERYGDEIVIHSGNKGKGRIKANIDINILGFQLKKSLAISSAKVLEATKVDIECVNADIVNGQYVRIGSGCIIQQVDCDKELYIARSAEIEKITGNAEVYYIED